MEEPMENETTKIALFKGRTIRRTLYENEWWFSVVDVVAALIDSPDSGAYCIPMSSNYNKFPRPAVVLIRSMEKFLIRSSRVKSSVFSSSDQPNNARKFSMVSGK